MSFDTITALCITEAHHVHNQFWDLGRIVHEVPAAKLFEHLVEESCGHPASHEVACYIVDALNEAGEIVTDKEISRALAEQLLDEPITVLRRRSKIAWYGEDRIDEWPDTEVLP